MKLLYGQGLEYNVGKIQERDVREHVEVEVTMFGNSYIFSDWDGMLGKAWVGAASETEDSNSISHNQTARARRRGNCSLYSLAHSESLGLKKKRQYGRK